MKEEKDLITKYGKKAPFKVPEGYFEQFHEQIMNDLPKMEIPVASTPKISLLNYLKPVIYMAAMFLSIIFVIQGLMYVQDKHFTSDNNIASTEEIYTEEADHFMYSSLYNEYALYSYLTTEENY